MTHRSTLAPTDRISDELREVVGERTLALLERRRRNTLVNRRGWLVRRMLLVADLVGLALAFLIAEIAFGQGNGKLSLAAEYVIFIGTLPAWIVASKLYGLYDNDDERTDHATTDEVITLFHFVTVGTWLLFSFTWITRLAKVSPEKFATFWGAAIVLISMARIAARAFVRKSPAYVQNAVIVGAGTVGRTIAQKLEKHPEYGINFVGFVDHPDEDGRPPVEPYLGSPEELPGLVRLVDVERVIVAFPNQPDEETLELVHALKDIDIQVDLVPRLYDFVGPGVTLHTVEGLPLIGLPAFRLSSSSALMKRAVDLVLALTGLIVLSPILLALAAAIKLDSRGPVLFRQVRRGAGDRLFRLYKFRTMVRDAEQRKAEFAHLNKHVLEGGDPRMFKIENDPRVTRVGAFLRRYLLDEIPQLLNVVKGDMSLVGPRPLILEEDRYVERWARKRLDLKPGMTGLWQVLGRQAISFEEMVKLDYLYVTTWSLGNDLRILLRTVPMVLKGQGGPY